MIDTNGYDAAISGVIGGAGDLTKIGAGTLKLSGANPYTGATIVDSGVLSVDGSIASSRLTTVNAGATLGGDGVVGATLINGGALAPGNSIGRLTVQGDLTLTGASRYLVEVSPTAADHVSVTGLARLGGATVNAAFAAGAYVAKQYVILTAAGGVADRFATLVNTNLPSGFTSSLSYDVSNVYLNLALNYTSPANSGSADFMVLNTNQRSVANALVASFNRNGGVPAAFGALDANGLSLVSGEAVAGAVQSSIRANDQFVNLLVDPFVSGRTEMTAPNGQAADGETSPAEASLRLAYWPSARRAGIAPPALKGPTRSLDPLAQPWSLWGAVFGGVSQVHGDRVVGSHATTSRSFGVGVGADYRASPDLRIGFALAGSGGSFSLANGLGSGRSDMFQAGLLARRDFGSAFLAGAFAYSWQDVTTNRAIGENQLQGRFQTHSFAGRLEAGYRFASSFVDLTPYAAAQGVRLQLPSYVESTTAGLNTFALGYGSQSIKSTRSELGVRLDRAIANNDSLLILRGRAAWAHDFGQRLRFSAQFLATPGSEFLVTGARAARDAASVGASAEIRWANGFSLAGDFAGDFTKNSSSYSGRGVVRYVW